MAADPTQLPPGFQLDSTPTASSALSSLPSGFKLDTAGDMAASWRQRTGAAPDVPTPFDAGLPQSIPTQDMLDRAEQFSSAAGDTLTAGIERTAAGAHMIGGGIAGAVGNQAAADQQFATTQAERADAARLAAQGASQNKAGALTGNVLSFVPMIMAGGSAAPGLIGGQQALDTAADVSERGGTTGQAEKAFATALPLDVAVNAIPGHIPLGGSIAGQVAGPVVGAFAGAGGQAASQEIQHLVSPGYVEKPNLSDATTQAGMNLLTAVLTGGHGQTEAPETMDPFLRNYVNSGAEQTGGPPAPKALPAPDPKPSADEPQPPPPSAPAAPAQATADPAAFAEQAFKQDPATALHALDYPTLKQVAEDAGFEVKPGEDRASIVGKMVSAGPEYLASDVLPEYLANLSPGTGRSSTVSPPAAPTPTVAANEQQPPSARAIQPGTTLPVDTLGTAYTPEQGGLTLAQAIDQARGISGRLPEPVTTVDAQGNAVDSGAFTRAIKAQQDAAQRRLDLGLTPDILRAQAEHPGLPVDEMVGESDLTPTDPQAELPQPWWRAGQDAAEQAAREAGTRALQKEVPGAPAPLPDNIPIDATHDVPLGGGPAKDNSTTYIDRGIPEYLPVPKEDGSGDAMVNIHRDIAFHEAAEKPALDQGKLYADAHNENANSAEDGYLRQKYGVTRAAVDKALKPYLDAAAAKNPETSDIPANLDRKPYEDGGDTDMLPEASNELAKLGIPEELHPQALDFLHHVENAMEAGVDPEQLKAIARTDDELPGKIQKIQQLTREASGHEAQAVPRETESLSRRQVGETGAATAQPPGTAANRYQPSAGREQVPAGQAGQGDRAGEPVQQPGRELPERRDELGVPPALRRPDYSPEVEGRAITAIDDLVAHYGGSMLVDTIRDDLREHTVSQLIGKRIQSPEDLAAMASVYRNPAFETMRYIFTDRAGNVLGETAVSARMPSSTSAFPTGMDEGPASAAWITSVAPEGSTNVWLHHNHPSGNPKASRGDIDVTEALSIYLGDHRGAPKLAGHVISDHDTFGYIDAIGTDQGVLPLQGAEAQWADPNRMVRGDESLLATKMNNPAFADSVGRKIADQTPEGSTAVIVMSANGDVNSIHAFPNEFLGSRRGAALISRLGQRRGAAGIGVVMDARDFVENRAIFDNATERGMLYDAYVVAPDGRVLRMGDTEMFPRSQRRMFGQQSAATRARGESGVRMFENEPGTQPLISLSAVRRALADRGVPAEQIQAMTAEQLRAEQANLRRRSAPAPEEASTAATSSIKNASVAEERAMKGQAEVEYNATRQSDPETVAKAKQALTQDPGYGGRLAADLIAKPRPHTEVESQVLNLDKVRIRNATNAAYDALAAAREAKDTGRQAAAVAQIRMLDAQMDANHQASRLSGTETGRALHARQIELNADYSIAALTHRGREAAGGSLSDAQRESLAQRAREIEAREKAVAEREAALQNARREPRKPAEQKSAKAKFDSLAEQLKAIAQKDHLKPGCVV